MHAIVYYPAIDISKIQGFRQKYDPQFKLIRPHITLVFPLSDLEEKEIYNHIESVLKHHQPFKANLRGLIKSWDNWLFLTIKEGNKQIVKLHDDLYSGVMAKYLRTDIEYIPHVGLGLFSKEDSEQELDKILYEQALTEAENLHLDYTCMLDQISLIKLDDSKKAIVSERSFKLGQD